MKYSFIFICVFQSTPPVKAATIPAASQRHMTSISIHAAREGGDRYSSNIALNVAISIHAAREGGDFAYERKAKISFISIHAAREGGDGFAVELPCRYWISIHAAREGGDICYVAPCLFCKLFQSTPPVKAATPAVPL